MGQFSWLDCCNNRPIMDNREKDVYVLVPEEFRDTYGERIKEEYYDGYGNFGGYDAYDLVAIWNRDHIGKENIRVPEEKRYAGKEYYERAVDRYNECVERIEDFAVRKLTDEKMQEKWGGDYLREIGIDIACYDEENSSMEYPLKITYNPDAVYEACPPSAGDPEQGWSYFSEAILKTPEGIDVENAIVDISETDELDYYDVRDALGELLEDFERRGVKVDADDISKHFRYSIDDRQAREIADFYNNVLTYYDRKFAQKEGQELNVPEEERE